MFAVTRSAPVSNVPAFVMPPEAMILSSASSVAPEAIDTVVAVISAPAVNLVPVPVIDSASTGELAPQIPDVVIVLPPVTTTLSVSPAVPFNVPATV